MKKNSKTNQSTEEKDEKMKTIEDIRKHLNKYENIKNSKDFTYRQKDILSLMLFRGNGQDEGFTMGYKHIMDIFGYSSTAISAAISLFKDYNFISVEKGHTGTNSKYILNYEAMKNFKSSSTVSVSDSEIREAKSEKRSKIREEKTYDTVIQLLTRLLSDLQIREEKRRESEKIYIADIQALIHLLSDKFDTVIDLMNQRLNININNNINKNLKDNISSNNNTEEYNLKDQEKKKNISTGNLEKLKENSTVEIPNDEDIQRENESLDESRIPSESRIETRDNISTDNISTDENPNDMPPLDVDCFFENNYNQYTEYRDNENLNESRIPSEDGRIETRDNISTDNISDNENSKADEIDCSVFGNETFDSDTISKTQNLVPRCVDGRFVVVEDNSKANNISNDNNSSENMKKTKISKGEISNKSNISNKGKISKKANSSNSFIHFGRLVGVCDMKGNVEEYLFNAYDTLKTADDFSEKFTETTEITIDLTQLEVSQDCGSGVWGMLSFNNGEYSFTQSNVNTQYSEKVTQSCAAETAETSNNVPQGDETSEVDNHTAKGEKIDSTQSQIANKESEGNTNTTSDNKKDEKATEMPNADEKNAEVDNHTTDEEKTAGNSVKMRPEPSDSNTNTEKVDSTQSQNANKASNEYADDLEDDAETIAIRERVMRQNAARAQQTEKKSDDNAPKVLDYYKRTPDGWKEIPVHITMENKKMTMGEALELYKNFDNPLKYIYSIMRYVQDFCDKMKCALRLKAITDEQFNAFKNELNYISERYKAYWRKRFSYQEPDPNSSAEKDMHRWLGSPKVTQGKN